MTLDRQGLGRDHNRPDFQETNVSVISQKVKQAAEIMHETGAPRAIDWSILFQALITAVLSMLGSCALSPKQATAAVQKPGLVQRLRLRRLIAQTAGTEGHERQVFDAMLDVGYSCTETEVVAGMKEAKGE